MILPDFIEGIHYRQLRGGRNRFELLVDVTLVIPQLATYAHHVSFVDLWETEWLRINRDRMTARKGYAWNGASPCWWVGIGKFGCWVGTWTPKPARLPTLFHDLCFQFLRTKHWPLTITQCNTIFFEALRAGGFKLANTYHGAVTDFGELFAGKYPKRGEFSIVLPPVDIQPHLT